MVHRRCAGPPRHPRVSYARHRTVGGPLATYGYIQQLHTRAVERREWLDDVDSLFRLNGVALLAPYPVEE
jgi:hypothetical protein